MNLFFVKLEKVWYLDVFMYVLRGVVIIFVKICLKKKEYVMC